MKPKGQMISWKKFHPLGLLWVFGGRCEILCFVCPPLTSKFTLVTRFICSAGHVNKLSEGDQSQHWMLSKPVLLWHPICCVPHFKKKCPFQIMLGSLWRFPQISISAWLRSNCGNIFATVCNSSCVTSGGLETLLTHQSSSVWSLSDLDSSEVMSGHVTAWNCSRHSIAGRSQWALDPKANSRNHLQMLRWWEFWHRLAWPCWWHHSATSLTQHP